MSFDSLSALLAAMLLIACAAVSAAVLPISAEQCVTMQATGVITKANPVTCARLRRVNFQHLDFDGMTAVGNVVVFDAVADQVDSLFDALLAHRFPLQKARLMEHYQGDDQAAMRDNNTSAFNGRAITGGGSWSKHAYGLAIDINPMQNPYMAFDAAGRAQIQPAASAKYFVNRRDVRPGKPVRAGMAESVLDIFAAHGFMVWGGDWDAPIDYQHFEIGSRALLAQLLAQTPDMARQTFNRYAQSYRDCVAQSRVVDARSTRALCVAQAQK